MVKKNKTFTVYTPETESLEQDLAHPDAQVWISESNFLDFWVKCVGSYECVHDITLMIYSFL